MLGINKDLGERERKRKKCKMLGMEDRESRMKMYLLLPNFPLYVLTGSYIARDYNSLCSLQLRLHFLFYSIFHMLPTFQLNFLFHFLSLCGL